MAAPVQPVVADACFLINFLAVDRMDILGSLGTFRFHCPREVAAEVVRPIQAQRLARAIADGIVLDEEITNVTEMAVLAELLREQLGRGETACLALSQTRGWLLASDERGRFRRLALERLGAGRVMTTGDAMARAVATGILTGAEARTIAEDLRDNHRFAMAIPENW